MADTNSDEVALLEKLKIGEEALKGREDRMLAMEARMIETASKADTVIKLSLRGREFHTLKENLLMYEESYFYGLVSSGAWMPDHNGDIPFKTEKHYQFKKPCNIYW